MRVLILGGTMEARLLAEALGATAELSLAGATAAARARGARVGGFAGVGGLAAHLRAGGFGALVDATHPFAVRISATAVTACATVGVPRLVLTRPPWSVLPGWIEVPDLAAAAAALAPGARVFLTTGRGSAPSFAPRRDVAFVLRVIDPGADPLPGARVVVGRPPQAVEAEAALMRAERIDTLVAKNSGGPAGKLEAAAALGLRVILVARPPAPPGPCVATVAAALDWLGGQAK